MTGHQPVPAVAVGDKLNDAQLEAVLTYLSVHPQIKQPGLRFTAAFVNEAITWFNHSRRNE